MLMLKKLNKSSLTSTTLIHSYIFRIGLKWYILKYTIGFLLEKMMCDARWHHNSGVWHKDESNNENTK